MTREEAIKIVKEFINGTCLHLVDQEALETLIPELRESEDERIRKALIEGVSQIRCKGDITREQMLAYLEKQKEASKAIEAVERIDKYIDQHLANAHDMKDSNPDKKYYRGWDDALGKMAGILQDVYSGGKKKESLRDFIDDFPYSDQKEPENISASTMIPSFHEELTEFELVLFNAVLDNNFVGAKGSENALAMTKKVAPELLAIAKKEPDWDREKCFVCQEYEKGFKQGHLEGCTAGYNKAMKEVDEQKEQKSFNVCEQCECPDYNEQKPTERIDFDNKFENQVSHLLASVLNGEHEYNESFVKYVAQSLLGYAKNEIKPDEWDKREKLFTKALQTANTQIGQLFEENKKLKERKPTEIDEYKIIKKHITEDSLSSEVNKRLKECGWYVTDTESSEWSEEDEKDIAHIIRILDDCYAYGKHDLSKTDHENLVGTLKSIHPQLKSEWNDEDEGELQNAIDALEFLGKKGVYKSESGYDAALQAASWLKLFCLQPKSKWNEDYLEEDIQTRFAFYTYKDDPSTLYLSNVFVEETSRNKGFGTKILMAAENVAETLGAISIRLKVKQDNPANVWYLKHGYNYITSEGDYDWLEKNLKYLKPKKSIKWSGDDELMIESLTAYLKGTGQDFISNDMVYWLKSLPERFNLQPKQEWSEEEKDKLNNIERLIVNANAHGNYLIEDKEAIDLQHFIRSIVKPTTNLTEWSEEDRLHYANVLNALEYVKGCKSDYDKIEAVKSDIAWLRELPERFNLPPKQEWSEEDEEKLKAICTYLRDYSRLAKLDDKLRFNEYCDFLESLRPSWKPSEHQMTILKAVKEYVGRGSGYWGEALGSLIEDLEKLM